MLVDKIKNIVPEAEIDESGILTVTVEPAKYSHPLRFPAP